MKSVVFTIISRPIPYIFVFLPELCSPTVSSRGVQDYSEALGLVNIDINLEGMTTKESLQQITVIV